MKFSVQDIEQIASRAPNMRANTLLHHLRKLEKAEELRAKQVQEQTEDKPISFFDKLLRGWS